MLSDELSAKPGLKGILGLQPSNSPEVVTKTGKACGTTRLMRLASWPILPLWGWVLTAPKAVGQAAVHPGIPQDSLCKHRHMLRYTWHSLIHSDAAALTPTPGPFFLLCFIPAKAMFRPQLPEQPQCWVLTPGLLLVSKSLWPALVPANLRLGHCLSTQNPSSSSLWLLTQLRSGGSDRLGLQYTLLAWACQGNLGLGVQEVWTAGVAKSTWPSPCG